MNFDMCLRQSQTYKRVQAWNHNQIRFSTDFPFRYTKEKQIIVEHPGQHVVVYVESIFSVWTHCDPTVCLGKRQRSELECFPLSCLAANIWWLNACLLPSQICPSRCSTVTRCFYQTFVSRHASLCYLISKLRRLTSHSLFFSAPYKPPLRVSWRHRWFMWFIKCSHL